MDFIQQNIELYLQYKSSLASSEALLREFQEFNEKESPLPNGPFAQLVEHQAVLERKLQAAKDAGRRADEELKQMIANLSRACDEHIARKSD